MTSDDGIPARAERGLELLWAGQRRSGRARRGLSLDSIVAAGITIADAEGLDGLSMRRVAADLGAGTMSLYRYVPGREELVDLMVDAVTGEIPFPEPGPEGWRARLAWSAHADWALYKRHRWALRVLATTRPPLGPNVLAMTEYALASVCGLGLGPRHMSWLVMMVTGYVQGAALLMVNETEARLATGAPNDQWWATRGSQVMGLISRERFPTLASVASSGIEPEDLDTWFAFGLERVLDGIGAFLARANARDGQTS